MITKSDVVAGNYCGNDIWDLIDKIAELEAHIEDLKTRVDSPVIEAILRRDE